MRVTAEQVEEQKVQIVQTALVIFSQKGFAATNMMDVAKALNISRTPLYYHFGNKEQLFTAAFHEHATALYEKTREIYESDDTIFNKIRQELTLALSDEPIFGERIRGELRVHKDRMPEAYAELKQLRNDIFVLKKQAFITAKQKGEIISDADDEHLAIMIYTYYYGLTTESMHAFMTDIHRDMEQVIEVFVDLFVARYGVQR